jgi:putative peptide zinc metalloprotease protein
LYRIAELSDGKRTPEEIADVITSDGEPVQPQTIRRNLAGLLIPTGVVVDGAGHVARPEARPQSPLSLAGRMKMLGPGAIEPLTGVLKLFFLPPVVIVVVAAALGTRGWLYFVHGLAEPARDALDHPFNLLILFALVVLSAGFHEFGHAAALRYGGGRVKGMGVGLYMIYPAVYTDVTENYRLSRWARIRTDLGGFHFNLVFSLAVFGLSLVTGNQYLLVFLVLTDLEILQQSLPFVRFDGYWALADLTGIPDFFTHMTGFWRHILRRSQPSGTRLPKLKRWGTVVLAVYSLVTVPILLIFLLLTIAALPRVLATAWESGGRQVAAASLAWSHHDAAAGLLAGLQLLILIFPAAAMAYMLVRTFKQFVTRLWSWAGDSTPRRGVAALATVGSIAVCGFLWAPALPHGGRGPAAENLVPISPGERGTFSELVAVGARSISGSVAGTATGATSAPPVTSTPNAGASSSATPATAQPSPSASPSPTASATPSPSPTP